ncbi:MAG: roadblock/LC7 domain-containing protein [Methanomicrobiales archaeon]|nr:roadblock/LC7 domain-containing protein [Methanomicrobiales archaeon]
MILPEGTVIGKFSGSLSEIGPFISPLIGVLHIMGISGEGFLLIDQGKFIASYYKQKDTDLKGNAAYTHLVSESAVEFEVRKYNEQDFADARKTCSAEGLLIAYNDRGEPLKPRKTLGTWNLETIQKQPGVLAVAAFHDGFAVQSTGNADFDQVAAVAEDLLRAGKKIATDLTIEPLDQMILETPHGKFIIAPFGDINICIFTEADANLGLIRIAIRNIQSEID